jgi:hypothetical protein
MIDLNEKYDASEKLLSMTNHLIELRANEMINQLGLGEDRIESFTSMLCAFVQDECQSLKSVVATLKALTVKVVFKQQLPDRYDVKQKEHDEDKIIAYLETMSFDGFQATQEVNSLQFLVEHRLNEFQQSMDLHVSHEVLMSELKCCLIKADLMERSLYQSLHALKYMSANLVLFFDVGMQIGEIFGKDFSDMELVTEIVIA